MNNEEVHQRDTEIEAMLALFNIDQPAELNCDTNKAIEWMCVNPKCSQTSLHCSDLSCK